jgi:hypothetical protein
VRRYLAKAQETLVQETPVEQVRVMGIPAQGSRCFVVAAPAKAVREAAALKPPMMAVPAEQVLTMAEGSVQEAVERLALVTERKAEVMAEALEKRPCCFPHMRQPSTAWFLWRPQYSMVLQSKNHKW